MVTDDDQAPVERGEIIEVCGCGWRDCDHLAFGYPFCAKCREHHRDWPDCPGEQHVTCPICRYPRPMSQSEIDMGHCSVCDDEVRDVQQTSLGPAKELMGGDASD